MRVTGDRLKWSLPGGSAGAGVAENREGGCAFVRCWLVLIAFLAVTDFPVSQSPIPIQGFRLLR